MGELRLRLVTIRLRASAHTGRASPGKKMGVTENPYTFHLKIGKERMRRSKSRENLGNTETPARAAIVEGHEFGPFQRARWVEGPLPVHTDGRTLAKADRIHVRDWIESRLGLGALRVSGMRSRSLDRPAGPSERLETLAGQQRGSRATSSHLDGHGVVVSVVVSLGGSGGVDFWSLGHVDRVKRFTYASAKIGRGGVPRRVNSCQV